MSLNVKKTVSYLLLGVLAYGAFLIATFPAQRAMSMVQAQVPQLRVAGVSGTAWSGSASTIQVQGENLQRVNWDFSPTALLVGQIAFDLSFRGDGRSGEANVGLRPDGGIALNDINAKLPAVDVSRFLKLGPISLEGMFELQMAELVLVGDKVEAAEGNVYWRKAGVSRPVEQQFGELLAELTTDDKGVKANIKDEGGPLQLQGSASLNSEGAYTFEARAKARDAKERMLEQGLRQLGTRQPDGQYLLELSGKI